MTAPRFSWTVAIALFAIACAGGVACGQVDSSAPVQWRFEVVKTYPHDPAAFTQGLVVHEGRIYEGTGLRPPQGQSSLRLVELATGRVQRQRPLDGRYFGEGITILGNRIYQLTWQEQTGFVYNLDTFDRVGTFRYQGEGWGLTHNDAQLIMSDGTPVVRFMDPQTFSVVRTITVHDGGTAIERLNELEYIDGEIWANIWQTDRIVRFSPRDGRVTGWIDLATLYPDRTPTTDVLNGIAYDTKAKRLLITGKLWPRIYEIVLKRP